MVIRDYLARRVGPQSAEDLTGETFLVAFSKRDKYDVSQPNALPWLYGIASNLVRQRRRTEVRQRRALARTGVDPVFADHAAGLDIPLGPSGEHRTRMWWQVGTTGAAVTAMAAALFVLPSAATRTQPANENGVVHNPDGTITIEFRELTDLRDVNMEFYEAGIRGVILGPVTGGVVECWTKYEVTPSYPAGTPTDVVQPRPNPWADELTFHPDRIPADMWLYIQGMVESRVTRKYHCAATMMTDVT